MRTYLFGGRLGDVIHGLVIARYVYDTQGEMAQIYLADIGDRFTAGIDRTFAELAPILNAQAFVESFEAWDGRDVDYPIWQFRNYKALYESCWTDSYFDMFIGDERPGKNYKWLEWHKGNYGDCLLINRGYVLQESTPVYLDKIRQHTKGRALFVCSDEAQWRRSELAGETELLLCSTLSEVFTAINGCGEYLGDQSAFTAIAFALGAKRAVELNRLAALYEGEKKYHDNLETFRCGYVPYEMTR